MNTSSPTGWAWRRCFGPPMEQPFSATAASAELVANRWQEESKRRYEELAHQWLELAEQRQRCA